MYQKITIEAVDDGYIVKIPSYELPNGFINKEQNRVFVSKEAAMEWIGLKLYNPKDWR